MRKACSLIYRVKVLATLLLSTLAGGAVAADSHVLVPPFENIAGRSQSDWSRAWWQWAGSFQQYESPIADKTGARCGLKQSGAVWFLAGTYGTGRTIRTCSVPAGKLLFFPLINYIVGPAYAGRTSCESVRGLAREMTDGVSSLVLELDGKVIENLESHRQETRECFDLAERVGGGVFPSEANGYYVMLRPLSRGTHTLNFGGILPSMSQAVTYTLHVE